jgi:thioredoxin
MTIVTCPNCGAKNRVDEAKAATTQPVCGKCKTPLIVPVFSAPPSDGKPIEVTDATFDKVVKEAGDRPVLIDAWATWCPPCRALAPTIDALAKESNGKYVVGKLDTDRNPATASKFQIQSIPTMLIFKNGNLVDTLVGAQPKPVIAAKLAQHAA